MRGVAARLGVAAMSPYRYVPSKDDLVLLMADAAFGEEILPRRAPEGLAARLELGARTLWGLYRRHPWLAQLGSLTRPLLVPNLMVHGEWMLGALDGHGLDPTTLFDIHVLIYSYVQGLAVHLEMGGPRRSRHGPIGRPVDGQPGPRAPGADGIRPLPDVHQSGRILTEGTDGADGYDLRLDGLFEFGLSALLDGLTPVIEGR